MSIWEPQDPSVLSGETTPAIAHALDRLRASSRERWVEVADDVLVTALRTSRPSRPVRAHSDNGVVHVSDQVVSAYLQQRLDAGLPDAAVGAIVLRVDRTETLQEVTIELVGRFGAVLIDLAEHARSLVRSTLREVLGHDDVLVRAEPVQVHFSDVIKGDPHLVHPSDES